MERWEEEWTPSDVFLDTRVGRDVLDTCCSITSGGQELGDERRGIVIAVQPEFEQSF